MIDIKELVSRTTYRVTINKKNYLCCMTECLGKIKFSLSREWGFRIRPHTELWEKIYRAVSDKYK